MPKTEKIEPRFVIVEGQLRDVSEFSHLKSRERPPAFCPLCDAPVVLKLGDVTVHHYAHQRETGCVASASETALHLNTKFHFYQQLQNVQKQGVEERTLYLEQLCSRCLKAKKRHVWLRGWDDVKVEHRMDSIRPDIALLSQGREVAALEIFVTHAVDERKVELLAAKDISWLEIKATPELYMGSTAWTAVNPLPQPQHKLPYDLWKCEACSLKLEQERRKEAQRAHYERENFTEIHAAMMVDIYYGNGKKYRDVFYVKKRFENGQWVEAWLENENNKRISPARRSITAPLDNGALHPLKNFVDRYIADNLQRGNIVDIIAPWPEWRKGKKFVARDTRRFPFRYFWDASLQQWVSSEKGIANALNTASAALPPAIPTVPLSEAAAAVLNQAHDVFDEYDRSSLVLMLGDFPFSEVVMALKVFARDPSKRVRIAAEQALVDSQSKK